MKSGNEPKQWQSAFEHENVSENGRLDVSVSNMRNSQEVLFMLETHRPGGVVIFGSHVDHSPLQYAWLCATWNGSSLGGGKSKILSRTRTELFRCLLTM